MTTRIGTAANYLDLLAQLDDFLTAKGHAFGKTYSGVGDGDLTAYSGTATSVAETFTITATGATTFTVSGSVSGAMANATVGTPYTSAKVEFTITAGTTPFSAGDTFAINTSPKWSRLRAAGCPDNARITANVADVLNLFDGDSQTFAQRVGARTCEIDFEMWRPSEVRQIAVATFSHTDRAPTGFSLQYRDNVGDAWVTAQTWAGITWANSYQLREFTLDTPPGAHKFWRFAVLGSNGSTVGLVFTTLQLREKVGAAYTLEEHAEIAWSAPGLDGGRAIYVGAETYGRTADDVWNIGFTGFRAWSDLQSIKTQANATTPRYLSLVNSPIAFWFVANGQRVIIVTRAAGVYQTAYLGLGFPYEPPSLHPYPAIIGASDDARTGRYDRTTADYRHPADPGRYGLTAFYPDGQWRNHANRVAFDNSQDSGRDSETGGLVWPSVFAGPNVDAPMTWVRDNMDGSRSLLPLVLIHEEGPRHYWGEFDGYFWTTGFGTAAEAIIRQAGFDHLVVNNIYRTGPRHYAAVRLD